jgi:DNA-binding CsgD family transcriptional regulator
MGDGHQSTAAAPPRLLPIEAWLEITDDAVIMTDVQLRVTSWSQAAQRLFHRLADDGVGADLLSVTGLGASPRGTRLLADLEREGQARGTVTCPSDRTATEPRQATVVAAHDLTGRLAGYLAVFATASPRRRAQAGSAGVEALTRRELEIMGLMVEGLESQAIAQRLFISERTERNHVASILAKLGVHSRLQALLVCLRHGVVDLT